MFSGQLLTPVVFAISSVPTQADSGAALRGAAAALSASSMAVINGDKIGPEEYRGIIKIRARILNEAGQPEYISTDATVIGKNTVLVSGALFKKDQDVGFYILDKNEEALALNQNKLEKIAGNEKSPDRFMKGKIFTDYKKQDEASFNATAKSSDVGVIVLPEDVFNEAAIMQISQDAPKKDQEITIVSHGDTKLRDTEIVDGVLKYQSGDSAKAKGKNKISQTHSSGNAFATVTDSKGVFGQYALNSDRGGIVLDANGKIIGLMSQADFSPEMAAVVSQSTALSGTNANALFARAAAAGATGLPLKPVDQEVTTVIKEVGSLQSPRECKIPGSK